MSESILEQKFDQLIKETEDGDRIVDSQVGEANQTRDTKVHDTEHFSAPKY